MTHRRTMTFVITLCSVPALLNCGAGADPLPGETGTTEGALSSGVGVTVDDEPQPAIASLQWATTLSPGTMLRKVVAASDGSLFGAGSFYQTAYFGGTCALSAAGQGGFVAKFSATGACVWARSFGDSPTQHSWASALAVLEQGNQNLVYVAGQYSGTGDTLGCNFDGQADGLVIAALDFAGTCHYGRRSQVDGGGIVPLGIVVEASLGGLGQLSMVGYVVANGFSLGGAWHQAQTNASRGFYGRYTTSLGYLPHSFEEFRSVSGQNPPGSPGSVHLTGIARDAFGGDVLVGYFDERVYVSGGNYIQSAGGSDVIAARITSNAQLSWTRRFGDAEDQHAFGVTSYSVPNQLGDLAMIGDFKGSITFGPSNNGMTLQAGTNDSAIYVAKLASDMSVGLWARAFGSNTGSLGHDIVRDPSTGDLLSTGRIRQTVDLGAGPINVPNGTTNAFLLRLDANGQYVASNTLPTSAGLSLNPTPDGGSILSGYFTSNETTQGLLARY